jgi:hypothetical protein
MWSSGEAGLLWRDYSTDIHEVIARGKVKFRERTQSDANCCHVHPTRMPNELVIDGIRFVPDKYVWLNHYLFIRGASE